MNERNRKRFACFGRGWEGLLGEIVRGLRPAQEFAVDLRGRGQFHFAVPAALGDLLALGDAAANGAARF